MANGHKTHLDHRCDLRGRPRLMTARATLTAPSRRWCDGAGAIEPGGSSARGARAGGDRLGEGEGDVGARAWPTDWTGLERR